MTSYTEMKNATAIKNTTRADMVDLLRNFAIERFGKENVSVINSNEIAIYVETTSDINGFDHKLTMTIKPTIKNGLTEKQQREQLRNAIDLIWKGLYNKK